jgi:hypothetical protein
MPALAHTMSSRPCSASVRSTAASHSCMLATSSWIVNGAGEISAAARASASALRAASTGNAPRRASSRAVAAPMPRDPPVINTTFSFSVQPFMGTSFAMENGRP